MPAMPALLAPPAAEMDTAKHYLVQTEACSCVHHKEQYIPQAVLDGERRQWQAKQG